MNFIDTEMERNDELTSPELTRRILLHFGLQFSTEKVRRLRQKLGWVQTGTKYCQLIREPNRVKQLEFSEKCLRENEQFDNVILTDECSVLLENHSKLSFHRKREQPKLKGKPKHPVSSCLGGHFEEGANRIDGFRGHYGRAVLCLRDPQQWAATIYPKNLPRRSSIPTRQ